MSRIGLGLEGLHQRLPAVTSAEGAIAVALAHVEKAETARRALDQAKLVETQRRAYELWAILYGKAQGVLEAFVHCRLLDDVAHDDLGRRLLKTAERRVSPIV